ncbi:response regulator [Meridianimarinicoccus aquatilis]|uniref:Response regulator n=1 Tax=Meridianimarinicoccus aquatilis TaxID=2552766 RepID=A0A4R6AJQ3_9RHOB|nr:response regulator [Fluviibacterium aquatile]
MYIWISASRNKRPYWRVKLKYLIVEDDPNLRLLWRSVLGEMGCDVSEAATLDEATSALASQSFDAMILDLYLGRDSGLSLAMTVETENPGCKVIIVTGAADVSEANLRAQAASIVSVHRKPVDIEDLMGVCSRLAAAPIETDRAANA